jgi:Pro-kumamolisin, activation domain
MPGSQRLSLALTLPLRNQEQLDTLLQQLDDRTSPNYHRYLTSAQFTEQFGPTVAEYQQVVDFAQSHGLTVTHTSPSRMLLDVSGSVADIELAFQLTMQVYQHPTENRTFYAPNVDPTVEAGIPMLGAAGLTDRVLRHPASLHRVAPGSVHPDTTGSGSGGQFYGSDIRAAYYGTGPLTGGGQALALAEGPWNVSDIQAYFKSVNQALNVPIVNEVLTGQNPNCIGLPPSCDDGEEVIDIEQIISMAPGASVLIVYEGVSEVDEFDAYATDNIAKVMSFSFGVGSSNATSDEQQFARFHAQGQNFFVASGDGGDFNGTGGWPGFSQNVTDVGGTDLVTSSPGGPWQSETGWIGSGGGWCDSTIPPPNGPCYQSPYDAIPNYQVQVITAANGGSTLYRNVPDVAAEANTDNFFCANGSCQGGIGGTSLAAPRFAGFVALANEQAAANGEMVGFLNTTVYAIGQASNYNTAFHDITSGSNNGFNAVVGYDLVTGWGTPNGQGMIDALAPTGGTSPYFTVSASPTTLNVTPGGAGQTSIISLTAANGFTGTVALTANVLGAPAGVTATLSPTSITAGQTSTLTVAADSSTNSSTFVNGNVEVVVTGTSAGGIQTQPAYVTLGVPDFALSAAPSGVYLNQSSTVNSTVTVTPQNGFGGSVTFSSVTGLPSGVTASFNPTSTTSTSTLTLTASSTAATGPGSALNVIGTSGNITQYAPATTLSVSAATGTGGSGTPVDLSSAYNLNGIYTDGTPFTTGVDGLGSAYSSNLLTGNRILNGVQFNFGPANKLDAVSDTGQSITLPAGQFTTLQLLATSFNGPVLSQTIIVTYTDTTTSTFTQGFSDWCGCSTNPGGQAGESFAVVMPYRDLSTGKQDDTPFNLYGYTFVLNSAKTVKSITLPNNKNVVVLAATLTSQSLGTPVSLSSEYNIAGIFANGVTFEGTGDIDGTADTDACGLSSGCSDAYSEQQLGLTPTTPPTLTIKGTTFNFGTVNTADCGTGFPACISDVIDLTTAPGVTIPLPSGQQTAYTTLSMLGTAVNGSQTGTVTVTYTTGSPKTIDQAFSDWCNFTHNPNESIAVGAINRINSDGTLATGVPCNLYAYTYTLDSTRTVQSITLTYTGSSAPGDGAFVLAITLSGNTTTGPGFTLSAAPSSLSIAQGTGNTSTITMTPSGGFTGSVGLAATGLPSGVTASFNPTSTTGTSTLTLTASSSATTGPATVTVTGTSGSLTATTTISLTVTPPPNFTLSASPTTLSVAQGGNHTSTITVEPTNGFTGSVTLAASGLPTGVTAAFGTNPTTGTSVLTLTASSSAPIISNATVTIIGTSGSLTAPTTISLTVTPPANFTLSASPTSLSVAESGSNTSTITVNPTNGFTGSVMLAASALPSGVTAAFGTNPTTGTSVLTLTASSSAPIISNATVTVTGTSGSLTAPTTISLAVTPPESYALSTVGPTQGTIAPGGSSQATVTVTPANGYTGSVNLTCTVTSTVTFTPPQATCSASPNPVVLTANETSPPTSTLTFTTQGPSGAMIRHASTFYALWLPVPGLALIGLGLGSRDTRRKKLLGCLLLWIVLASLIVLPACGSSGNGGGGGGNPGTPAGTYTLTITGKDAANGLTQSNTAPTTVSVTVN